MNLSLWPLQREDFGLLASWLEAQHVSRWWDPRRDAEFLEEKYGPRIDQEEPTRVAVVEVDDQPIGIFQWCPAKDYAWWPADLGLAEGAVVIDALIGETKLVGHGVGTALLEYAVPRVLEWFPEAKRILAAPATANVASTRVLEKGGFSLVHEGELKRDGRPASRIYALACQPAAASLIRVDDFGVTDLPAAVWWSSPTHLESVSHALSRVASGEVEYLAARGLSGDALAKLQIDYDRPGPVGEISQLATRPEWEGRGLASRMIEEAERRINGRGCEYAAIGVEAGNERAAGMYERRGYRKWKSEPHEWWQQTEDGKRELYKTTVDYSRKRLS